MLINDASDYLSARKKWLRPQAIIFSNNSGGITSGVPQISGIEGRDFLILSDHNRSDISFNANRLEHKKRMVNGHMRSYHIADKMEISFSYNMLPSRSYSKDPEFNNDGVQTSDSLVPNTPKNPSLFPAEHTLIEYTADGGAGGSELVEWYKTNPGSFYVFLSYDKPQVFTVGKYTSLNKYSEVLEVFFSDFSYNVVKRGGSNHDLWDISISIEEV
jgi:hypothetical protein